MPLCNGRRNRIIRKLVEVFREGFLLAWIYRRRLHQRLRYGSPCQARIECLGTKPIFSLFFGILRDNYVFFYFFGMVVEFSVFDFQKRRGNPLWFREKELDLIIKNNFLNNIHFFQFLDSALRHRCSGVISSEFRNYGFVFLDFNLLFFVFFHLLFVSFVTSFLKLVIITCEIRLRRKL